MVESSRYDGERIGETLPPHVRNVLAHLGVWDRFARSGAREVAGTAAAWGDPVARPNDYVFATRGPGWHVDRAAFDELLATEAERSGAVLSRKTTVEALSGEPGRWTIGTSAGTLGARFVVDATGHGAAIARARGATLVDTDKLVAFARFFDETEGSRDPRTVVEAFAEGWWYTAGLPGGRRIVACVTDADVGRRLRLRDLQTWSARLRRTDHVAAVVAAAEGDGALFVRPMHTRRLDRAGGAGWVAVGDAASSFDPLSSQGILKALRSGIFGAYTAADALGGDGDAVSRYARFVAEEFDAYLSARALFYGREQRWPEHEFWRRRHAPASVAV